MDPRDIRHRFSHHPPRNQDDIAAHERVRDAVRQVAEGWNEVLGESREKSLAITHLEEAVMWANAALARARGMVQPPEARS